MSFNGIRGSTLELFRSYLGNRQQYVPMSVGYSNVLSMSMGVPRGSNLGPLLFLIYINHLVEPINLLQFSLFAAGTSVYLSDENPCDLYDVMDVELIKFGI